MSTAVRRRNAAVNILLVYGLVVLQALLTDLLKGDALFTWSPYEFRLGTLQGFVLLVALLAGSVLIALQLYRRRATFLPVRVIARRGHDELVQHKAIVLSLSTSDWKFDPAGAQLVHVPLKANAPLDPIPCTGSLNELFARLRDADVRWPWEQLLRGLQAHADAVSHVYLLASHESHRRHADCEALVRHYFPRLQLLQTADPLDFEDVEALLAAYERIARSCPLPLRELMIDVTGGFKVISIAAALFTVRHPDVEFQYVSQEGEKRLTSFNVVNQQASLE